MAVAGVVARVEIGVVMSNKHIKIVIKPQVQKSTKKNNCTCTCTCGLVVSSNYTIVVSLKHFMGVVNITCMQRTGRVGRNSSTLQTAHSYCNPSLISFVVVSRNSLKHPGPNSGNPGFVQML